MAFLEAQILQPKSHADFKHTSFEFNVKDIHPIDHMEMQKKTREMISSTLNSTATSLSKLQVSLANIQSQLKMEKIYFLAKDTKINPWRI